jgi:hypothetical protein
MMVRWEQLDDEPAQLLSRDAHGPMPDPDRFNPVLIQNSPDVSRRTMQRDRCVFIG